MDDRARISVVVPWHPSDEHRERVWRWVKDRYAAEHPTWQVVEGRGGDPWVKAEAVADGLERATGDILVVADADVWVDKIDEAVGVLQAGMAPWVIPHRLVHRLNRTATERVLEGVEPASAASTWGYDEQPYLGWAGGGVAVLRRADYDRAPMPRVEGWGQEDCSFALALDCVVGIHTRLDADLWHLWHPPQPRTSRRVGSPEGEELWRRYRKAARNRNRMLALIEEGRTHGSPSGHQPAGAP